MGKSSGSSALEIGEAPFAALVASSSKASSSQMGALATAALTVLLGLEEEQGEGTVLEEMEHEFRARTHSAMVCLFLEAAKLDLSYAELLSFLRSDCGFAEGTGEVVSQMFADRKEALRALIARTATRSYVPQLLGADWRLDYCVSSSEDRAVRELVYQVSLSTLDPVAGETKEANFVCTVEELQDLVARLKDACKSVERAVQSH